MSSHSMAVPLLNVGYINICLYGPNNQEFMLQPEGKTSMPELNHMMPKPAEQLMSTKKNKNSCNDFLYTL